MIVGLHYLICTLIKLCVLALSHEGVLRVVSLDVLVVGLDHLDMIILRRQHSLPLYLEIQGHRILGPQYLVLILLNQLKTASICLLVFGVIYNDLGKVLKYRLDQRFEHRLVLGVHGRTRVDLNEPDIKVFIHHEVIPKELKGVLSIVDHVLHTQSR